MPTWSELQASFTRALLQDDTAAAGAVLGDGLKPEARLALYRHHVFTTLTEVLKAAYPVVCRLVDERFFAYAADCYIRQQPPAGPCLFEYGASFARFLATFPSCCDLVYLPDVAWLEWAIHAAWYAEDAVPLDRECLRGMAPDDLASLTFTYDPSVSYVSSPWPIDRIWLTNQPDANPGETVRLDTGAAYLEIRRLDNDVRWRSLEFGTFAFRATLAEHRPLAEAFDAALTADPAFDLTMALQTLFAESLVVNVAVSLTRVCGASEVGPALDMSRGYSYSSGRNTGALTHLKRSQMGMAESTEVKLTCQQVTALLIDYVTSELDPASTKALQEHLYNCRDCVAFLHTYSGTIRATRSLRYEDIPSEMVDRVQQFLHTRITKTPNPS